MNFHFHQNHFLVIVLNCNKFIKGQTQKVLNNVKSTFFEEMSSGESTCILTDLEPQFYADYSL